MLETSWTTVEPLSPRMRNDGGKHQLNDYNSLVSTGARPTSTVIMKQMGWFGVAIGILLLYSHFSSNRYYGDSVWVQAETGYKRSVLAVLPVGAGRSEEVRCKVRHPVYLGLPFER